jgi:hypothetical protein
MFRYRNIKHALKADEVLELEGCDLNNAISLELGSHEGLDFATNTWLMATLPLPTPTDCYEDWIHTELGPHGRWIVRLLRFYRADRTQPWKSKELYVADRDELSVPLATAYGRAWLLSCKTFPLIHTTPRDYGLAS